MLTYIKLFFIVIYTIICSILALLFSLERSFTLYFWLTKAWPKGVLLISGVKLEITGLENIDKNAVYVFVSNHSSQFDIPALQYAVPNKFSMVFKKELAKIPLFGWQLQTGPYIIIDRQNVEKAIGSIKKAKEIMSKKRISALLFAEGTRSKTGEVQPFKRGAFHLAAEVKYPVVPVSVSGANKLLPKGKFKIKPGTIFIHFSKPISTAHLSNRKDELELMEKVRDIVIKNIKEVD